MKDMKHNQYLFQFDNAARSVCTKDNKRFRHTVCTCGVYLQDALASFTIISKFPTFARFEINHIEVANI